MKRNYIILLAALLTVACAGNGDIMSPTPQEGEILFSGSTVGPKVRTSYEDTETALRVNWVKNDLIGLFAESGGKNLGANFAYKAAVSGATSDFTAASRLNVIRWADETSMLSLYGQSRSRCNGHPGVGARCADSFGKRSVGDFGSP